MNKNIVDYLVTRENLERIQRAFHKKRLDRDVIITDVQKKIDASKVHPSPWSEAALRKGHRLNFNSYPTTEVINEFMEYLGAQYPSITKVTVIGRSVENRPIKMIRISNGNPDNKVMLLVGGEHAREWVAITSPLYIANNIITKFDEQPHHVKNKDWYIIPLLNPDGYEHSQKVDRLWRKNKRVNPNKDCPGVDLNRNFPVYWNLEDLSGREYCSLEYPGPNAESEPETRALVEVLGTMDKKPSGYLDFHSYGQFILYPWSAVHKDSPYKNVLKSTGNRIKQAIYQFSGREYTAGNVPELLYTASGSAIDFFHFRGVRLAYALEARDSMTGDYGFLLPPDQIEATGKEMLAVARTVAKDVDRREKRKMKMWF